MKKTRVIILNNSGKPIEFKKVLALGNIYHARKLPSHYNTIELVKRDYLQRLDSKYDLMFAYNTDRDRGVLYLGHFNDGIV